MVLSMLKRIDNEQAMAAWPRATSAAASAASETIGTPLGKALRLENLSRSFGARQVLDGLSLDVAAGEFVAIVGRSGVGKSTLMRLIVGLDKPTAGRVLIDDTPVDGLQKAVRLLFQDSRLLPWHSVLSNVGIARLPGWRETALNALRDVGLADRANDWPAVLSGGQRQRVALARVLVGQPGVLLLDEPFGALDALTRAEMHTLLEKLWLRHGFTTLLITHDVAEAVALADRVVVIKEGRVTFEVDVRAARPRGRMDPDLAALQTRILEEV
jgi:sulfonate transport system ATP-binding protein